MKKEVKKSVSQTADFSYTNKVYVRMPLESDGGHYRTDQHYNQNLKTGLLYGGIAVLILGAGIAVFSPSKQN